MELKSRRLGNGTLEVAPVGTLDETNVGELRPHLLDRGDRILLDLSGVQQIDSAAMALILLARIELEAMGGGLVVQASQPRIALTLKRAGLERFVTVADRRIDALRALRSPAEREIALSRGAAAAHP